MAGRERIVTRAAALLAGLLIALLAPQAALALPKAPVTSRLELAGTPAPGGVARVIWAGVPDVTPSAAELAFLVHGPDGQTQRTTQAIKLQAGKAADATLTLPTPRAGRYRVTAFLQMSIHDVIFGKSDEINIHVSPTHRLGKITHAKTTKTFKPLKPGELFLATASAAIKTLTIDGDKVDGELKNEGDEDWYQFDLATTRTITIKNVGDYSYEELSLFGPNDQAKEIEHYYNETPIELGPGTYYIMVWSFWDDSTKYSLMGFGNLPATSPKALNVDGDRILGVLDQETDDENWYQFTVSTKGFYTIETLDTDYDELPDTAIELFGPADKKKSVARDDDGGWFNTSLISRELEAGTYYIKVTGYGLFGIRVTKGSKGLPVILKTDGTNVKGKIDSPKDYEWYQFTVDKMGEYHVELTAGSMQSAFMFVYRNRDDGLKDCIQNWSDGWGDEGEAIISQTWTFSPNTVHL